MTTGPHTVAADALRVAVAGPALTRPLAELLAIGDGSPLPATAGTSVWQLADDLARGGRVVGLVTLDGAARALTRIDTEGFAVVVGPYRATHRMRDMMRVERRAVRQAVVGLAPDLVHAHWCYEYALGALASGTPTLVTLRDWIPAILRYTEPQYLPYWSGRALMYGATLACARYLTANSPYMADKVRHFTRGTVEIVPNGLPDTEFECAGEGHSLEERLATPIFVSVNNGFSRWKNVRALLRAFASLRLRHPAVELHLVGEGYEPSGACRRWAESAALVEGVRFLGSVPRPRLLDSLPSYVALVHPSREESFGMTLVEAMARRVPVIGGARSGAVPWVLAYGRAGMLVDVDDPRDIALAMEALLSDTALRVKMARCGHEHARRVFRQSRVTFSYLDKYMRVLEEEKGRR